MSWSGAKRYAKYEADCLKAATLPEKKRAAALAKLAAEYEELRALPDFPKQEVYSAEQKIITEIQAVLLFWRGDKAEAGDWQTWLDGGAAGSPPPTGDALLRTLAERLAWHRGEAGAEAEWSKAKTKKEIAKDFKVDVSTIRRWLELGKLKLRQAGGKWQYRLR